MRLILLCLLSVILLTNCERVTESEDFIRGVFRNAFRKGHDDIHDCITDGTVLKEYLDIQLQMFTQGLEERTTDLIKEGLFGFAGVFQEIPQEISNCSLKFNSSLLIEESALRFAIAEPGGIDHDIYWYGIPIKAELSAVVEEFKNENYETVGEKLGDIMRKVFIKNPVLKNIEKFTMFNEALFKSAFDINLDFTDCDENIQLERVKIEYMFRSLFHPSSIKGWFIDLIKLGLALRQFPDDFGFHCGYTVRIYYSGLSLLKPYAKNPFLMVSSLLGAFFESPKFLYERFETVTKLLFTFPWNYDALGREIGEIIEVMLRHV